MIKKMTNAVAEWNKKLSLIVVCATSSSLFFAVSGEVGYENHADLHATVICPRSVDLGINVG